MDHLPSPHRARVPYPKVPCLCRRRNVVTGAFELYRLDQMVERMGHDLVAYTKQSILHHQHIFSLAEIGPMLQAWLWFGTIETIFGTVGVAVAIEDFIAADDTFGLRLDTSLLNRYLWYWVAAEAGVSKEVQIQHRDAIRECLHTVWLAMEHYTIYERDSSAPDTVQRRVAYIADDDSNILLAIALLAEAFDSVQCQLYQSEVEFWRMTGNVRRWLLEAGWCVNELAEFLDQRIKFLSTQVHLSRIDRSISSKPHSQCSVEECVYSKIDLATYQPTHVVDDCCCSHVSLTEPDKQKIDALLHNGEYPVVTYSLANDSNRRLNVRRPPTVDEWELLYMAVSHVWSDRLGNLHDNALPACQLERIQTMVNSLYPHMSTDIPFWIDTICVPCEATTRKLAIGTMREVYARAERVLVLDSSLQLIDSTAPPEQILLAIKTSAWARRLWTWHEAILAHRIVFQLRDRAIAGDSIMTHYYTSFSPRPATVSNLQLVTDCTGPNARLGRSLLRVMALAQPEIKIEPGTEGDSSSGTVNGAWEWYYKELLPRWEAAATFTDPERVGDPNPITLPAQDTLHQEQHSPLGKDIQAWRHRVARARLRDRINRWLFPKQSNPFEDQSAFPLDWLAETSLNSSEVQLVETMKRIVCHLGTCRFWLNGFDPLFLEGSSFYINLRGFVLDQLTSADEQRKPSHDELAETFVTLSERSTSWIEDEPICLAIILGLDVRKVQQATGPERMEVLVRMWESVPRALFFLRAPRMLKEGLRWMPTSLLNTGLGEFIRSYHMTRVPAFRTECGLQLQATGVFVSLSEMQAAPDGQLCLEEQGDCYAIITSGIQELEPVDFEHDQCAVVFNYRPDPGNYAMAVLVSVMSREDDVVFARYVLRIGAFAPHLTHRSDFLEKSRSASFTSLQQKWCVG